MADDVIVETRKLTKVYRDFWGRRKKDALRALSVEIRRGEIFGLLGPNGSGKTTTIKLLLGLLFPTDGEAFVFGKPAADVRKNERVGYLPEESYLYRFLNAEETLDFYGRLFNMPAGVRRSKAQELIEKVGLRADRKRILREYSKGMRQRIGLAQALINDPDLVILDEPTSGLDPLGARWMKDLIRELRTRARRSSCAATAWKTCRTCATASPSSARATCRPMARSKRCCRTLTASRCGPAACS